MKPSNTENFTQRNEKRLISAREHLRAAVSDFENICAELKPESVVYSLILGQIVPKIKEIDNNSRGKIAISDILHLINEVDALE